MVEGPVVQVRGRFVDAYVADEVAEALNRWFRWIADPDAEGIPGMFASFGVAGDAYAWRLSEDVDWEMLPHARAVELEVRVDLETHDTWTRLAGLLRKLGALSTTIERETEEA